MGDFWRSELVQRGLRFMPHLTRALAMTSMHHGKNKLVFTGSRARPEELPDDPARMQIVWAPNSCPDDPRDWCEADDPIHEKVEREVWPQLSEFRVLNYGPCRVRHPSR